MSLFQKLALAGALMVAAPAMAQDATLYAWSPKPDVLPTYGQNKPVTRLPALLARHKGHARWHEQVILTRRYDAQWIQDAPGDKEATHYYGDDRVVWVVWGGQIRFTIAGQQPFVARKGFLVEVPQRVRFSMETIGSEPSLRFQVTHAGIAPVFAGDEAKPGDPLGTHYIKVSTPTQPDTYDAINRPYIDFFGDIVGAERAGIAKQTRVVQDEANMVNIIRGPGVPTPPDSNKGHFHIGDDEFWFVLEGRCDYLIEDVGLVSADAGDIVFVPSGRFHRASWALGKSGEAQMDTRLSFNVSPYLFHNFGADAGGRQ